MDFIPFNITIDLASLEGFFSQPLQQILLQIFFQYGGWVVFVIILTLAFFRIFKVLWLNRVRSKYLSKISYVLLAIDIPKENLQGPKAVEQMFAQLAGIHSPPDFIEKYWDGMVQLGFSLEIISLGGYIQFLIRTPSSFRDLVESAVFAQYPDAEISEMADYTEGTPDKFPDEEYDLWGAEFILYNQEAYPIRTYPFFEDKMSEDSRFKDPMAAILEILGKIGKDEQIWLQILITPTGTDWKKAATNVVKKILGKEPPPKATIRDMIISSPMKILESTGNAIFSHEPSVPDKKKDEAKAKDLTAGEKKILEAVENKMAKIGFLTKFRMIYLGKKESFSKSRGVVAVIGAIKQFNTLDMNGFKPDGDTKTGGGHMPILAKKKKASRQQKIMRAYKKRDHKEGSKPYVLNIEELATLYHFPMSEVKAPSIKKAEAKKGEPPFGLPIIDEKAIKEAEDAKRSPEELRKSMLKLDEPPANLPISEEEN